MTINKTQHDKFLCLEIEEKTLTNKDAPDFKAELVVACKKVQNIIIDLNHLEYIDSAGLSCLLIADRLTKDNNKISVVCNTNEKIEQIIKITKLENILTLVNSLQEAKDFVMMHELENEL